MNGAVYYWIEKKNGEHNDGGMLVEMAGGVYSRHEWPAGGMHSFFFNEWP